jgi:hypothetical protein
MGQLEAWKKARPRHNTTRNILVSGRHGPIYRAGFGPRSRSMGGHEHDPFKSGTKWPISILYLKHQFQRSSCVIFLQKTPHIYFKLICCTSIYAKRRPTQARCMRTTTMAQTRHAGLLTVSGQPVSPSIHLIKLA